MTKAMKQRLAELGVTGSVYSLVWENKKGVRQTFYGNREQVCQVLSYLINKWSTDSTTVPAVSLYDENDNELNLNEVIEAELAYQMTLNNF